MSLKNFIIVKTKNDKGLSNIEIEQLKKIWQKGGSHVFCYPSHKSNRESATH